MHTYLCLEKHYSLHPQTGSLNVHLLYNGLISKNWTLHNNENDSTTHVYNYNEDSIKHSVKWKKPDTEVIPYTQTPNKIGLKVRNQNCDDF